MPTASGTPASLAAAWQRALTLHQRGDLQQAERLYRTILQAQPRHPDANHNLGILALQHGQNAPALACFERALQGDPQVALFWASLAKCHHAMGEWEQAQALLDQAQAKGLAHAQFQALHRAMQGDPDAQGARRKIFCVGRNKTGTTSLAEALQALGFRLGQQVRGEMLSRDWARRDFSRIFALCRTADAFQDAPFSRNDTFRALDGEFPGSRFILTVRDNALQWYRSLVRFNTQIVGKGRVPTAEDLKAFGYRYPGYLWEAAQAMYGIDESTLYDEAIYTAHYENYNRQICEYFKDRPGDLLVLNVSHDGAMAALCSFLGIAHDGRPMPHLNRTT